MVTHFLSYNWVSLFLFLSNKRLTSFVSPDMYVQK